MSKPVYRDKEIEEVIDRYPNIALPWLLQCGYCGVVMNKPIVSDELFGNLFTRVVDSWDTLNSPYKRGMKKPKSISDIDFTEITPLLKSSALAQLKLAYPEGSNTVAARTKETLPVPVNTLTKPSGAVPSSIFKDKSRIGVQVEISIRWTDHKNRPNYSEILKTLANKYGLDYSGIAKIRGFFPIRAAAIGRAYSLMQALEANDICVEEYVISDVLVDSKKKDEWNFIKMETH